MRTLLTVDSFTRKICVKLVLKTSKCTVTFVLCCTLCSSANGKISGVSGSFLLQIKWYSDYIHKYIRTLRLVLQCSTCNKHEDNVYAHRTYEIA